MSDKDKMTIDQVCALLSISKATVRNWMKSQQIICYEKSGQSLLFDGKEIAVLKEKIETGESRRLQFRRNRGALKRRTLACEYSADPTYSKIAEMMMDALAEERTEICNEQIIQMILLEISLSLLLQRGYIDMAGDSLDEGCSKSLVEHWYDGRLQMGLPYAEILNKLTGNASILLESAAMKHRMITMLRKITAIKVPYIEGEDFLGLMYMALRHVGERSQQGSFYTPSAVTDHAVCAVIERITGTSVGSIVDPCCGSGSFLLRVYLEMEKKGEYPVLYGYDIDPVAVSLTKINLALVMDKLDGDRDFYPIIEERNTLLETDRTYDVVIGNPPWGYRVTEDERSLYRETYDTAKSFLESFSMFIEWGIRHLHANGTLAYVLPESLLHVKSHQQIRKMVLEQTSIAQIDLLGNCFSHVLSAAILLVLQKKSALRNYQFPVNGQHRVLQSRYLNNPSYLMNIEASDWEIEIIQHMQSISDHVYLRDHAAFALGIVTGDNKRHVLGDCPPGGQIVWRGNNVFKYNFFGEAQYFVYQPECFQQVAPEQYYQAPEKLVYRFINRNLIFAYDDRQRYTLNSANILIPAIPGYQIKYVMAILNSRAAQFFYRCMFSSVKILRSQIEAIPIPLCSVSKQNEIVSLVDQIMQANGKQARKELYEQIDRQVMDLYQLKEEYVVYIDSKFTGLAYLTGGE